MSLYRFLLPTLLFCTHLLFASTNQITINSGWYFIQDDHQTIDDIADVTTWINVNLPHTWNQEDPFDDLRGYKQGVGWYKRDMVISSDGGEQVFLKFEGVNQYSEIFINGKKAGEHAGGYTAFVVDISRYIVFDQNNQIIVRVDNRVNPNIPPLSGDFTFFGGIYRDVWLIRKSDIYFDLTDKSTTGVYLTAFNVSSTQAKLQVRTGIKTVSQKPNRILLETTIYDSNNQQVAKGSIRVRMKEGEAKNIVQEIIVEQPKLWTPDTPELYTVLVNIKDAFSNQIYDQEVIKTGFRWFEMDAKGGLLLNGQPLKLIGVNRHQDYPGLGNALPDRLHVRDIELIKEMGGNFIRIAHYPQDPAILEACDRLGLLVWEEIPIVNSIMVSDTFNEVSGNMLKEMIRQHYNHPSVIMWGLMNEVLLGLNKGLQENPDLTRESYLKGLNTFAQFLNSIAKQEDPYRWTALAHHLNYSLYQEAGLNDITDIVGWNIYFGWYSADMERAGKFLDDFHQSHPGKGIIVSEYGGDGVRMLHAVEPVRFDFTCEWQTSIHASYYRQIMERPHVMGGAAWVFADFSSEGRKDAVPGMNNKGLLNYNRTPKDSYLFYQAALSRSPYLAIGSRGWESRAGIGNEAGVLVEPVFIFSNQQEVELWLDDVHLGVFPISDYHARIMVPFKHGKNRVVAKGTGWLKQEAVFQVNIYSQDLSSMKAQDIDIRMNLGAHFHFIDPVTNEIWIPERPYQKGSLGFIGGKQLVTWNGFRVGTEVRIQGTANEPVYQTHRDSIAEFRADVPPGWYEVSLHLAEIYSREVREKLAYNLGNEDEDGEVDINRKFKVFVNDKELLVIEGLNDFMANAYRFKVPVTSTGLRIQLLPIQGSAFLSGVAIKGL